MYPQTLYQIATKCNDDELYDVKCRGHGQVCSKSINIFHIKKMKYENLKRLRFNLRQHKNGAKSLKWSIFTKTAKNSHKWNTHLNGTKSGFQLLFT